MLPPHRRLSQSHLPNNKICQQPPTPPSLPAQSVLLHPPPSSHPENSSCTLSPPPSLPSLTCPPPYYISCESISCKMCTARCAPYSIITHPFPANSTRLFTRVLHLT